MSTLTPSHHGTLDHVAAVDRDATTSDGRADGGHCLPGMPYAVCPDGVMVTDCLVCALPMRDPHATTEGP